MRRLLYGYNAVLTTLLLGAILGLLNLLAYSHVGPFAYLERPLDWTSGGLYTLSDRTRAVLKVNFPEPETQTEAAALAHWRGRGAVRVLEHDDERDALLLERCDPGTQLWDVADKDAANTIAAGVVPRIWRPPPGAVAVPTAGRRG